jgi:hypothetical protein
MLVCINKKSAIVYFKVIMAVNGSISDLTFKEIAKKKATGLR